MQTAADTAQPAILAPAPRLGRSLTFGLPPGRDPRAALIDLRDAFVLDWGIVAFGEPGESLDRFERALRHMLEHDDGIVDALFSFSRPVTCGYYWCSPVAGDRLELSRLRV